MIQPQQQQLHRIPQPNLDPLPKPSPTSTTIIQKIAALHTKPAYNELYIKGSRPLPVYKKHAHKVLLKHNTIIIHALTAAINKAVKLALYLMEEYPYLEQTVYTDSVPTLNIYRKVLPGDNRGGGQKQEGVQLQKGLQNQGQAQQITQKQVKQQEQYIVKQRSAIHIVLTKTIKIQQVEKKQKKKQEQK